MIEKVESTPHYRSQHSVFSYHRRQDSFERLHNPTEEKDRAERQAVLGYLNQYELVSIGIRKEILDADFYRDWMLGPFVRDWNAATTFIQRERWKWSEENSCWEYYSPLFENFQHIAMLWSDDAIRLNEHYSPPPEEPSGPGDEALPKTDGDKEK